MVFMLYFKCLVVQKQLPQAAALCMVPIWVASAAKNVTSNKILFVINILVLHFYSA